MFHEREIQIVFAPDLTTGLEGTIISDHFSVISLFLSYFSSAYIKVLINVICRGPPINLRALHDSISHCHSGWDCHMWTAWPRCYGTFILATKIALYLSWHLSTLPTPREEAKSNLENYFLRVMFLRSGLCHLAHIFLSSPLASPCCCLLTVTSFPAYLSLSPPTPSSTTAHHKNPRGLLLHIIVKDNCCITILVISYPII